MADVGVGLASFLGCELYGLLADAAARHLDVRSWFVSFRRLLLVALPPLMYTVLSVPGGVFADMWSARRVIGLGALLLVVGGFLRSL